MMSYKINFFQPKEFICPCCGAGRPAALLVLWLEFLRRAWDGPVVVNSGFRCAAHNREVGGAAQSRHLLGLAADIRPQAREFIQPFKSLVLCLGRLPGWELRAYPTFVHVAVPRGEEARPWDGGLISLRVE